MLGVAKLFTAIFRYNRCLIFSAFSVYCLLYGNSSAFAQLEASRKTADPARVQAENLNAPSKIAAETPQYSVKSPILQNMPQGAENIFFNLTQIKLSGISAYAEPDLLPLYKHHLGASVSLAQIYEIAAALMAKYRNDGYILTQVYIPPQTIDAGEVQINVLEGFIDKINIQGTAKPTELNLLHGYLDNLKTHHILNAKDLERNLLLINDLPNIAARAVLSPSQTTVGASDLTLITTNKPHEAEISFDNYGNRYLGAYQGTVYGALNSFLGYHEKIAGQFIMAGDNDHPDELALGSITYEQALNAQGTKASMRLSYSDTAPAYNLEEFEIRGNSLFLSLGASHPVIKTRAINLTLRGGIDMRNTRNRNNIEETRRDQIHSLRMGASFQYIDTWLGAAVNVLDFELAKGVSSFGASEKRDPNLSRTLGDPRYTKANLALQRLQRLTEHTNILIAAEGQLSAQPLLSAEEFGIGGLNIGRAYDGSEIVGDDGYGGKIEFQINAPTPLPRIQDYQLFTFIDYGKVWNQDATTNADKIQSLTSAGFGVRLDVTDKTKAGLMFAFPLTREIQSRADNDMRALFSISHKF